MSSTQRSRAIAALAALVTLLAVAAVLSSVLSGNNGDTAATGASVSTPPSVAAANLQVDAASLRSPGARDSQATSGSVPAADGSVTQATSPAASTTVVAGTKKTSTTVVRLPVAAAPGGGATSPPGAVVTTATSAKPGSTTPVTKPPVASSPTSVSVTQPKASLVSSTTMPSPTTTAKPTTTTVVTTNTTAATQPPPATGGMTAVELEVARMTNELRTNPNGPLARKKSAPSCIKLDSNGKVPAVPALTVSEPVSLNMSRPWSVDMNGRNTMDHRSQESATAIYTQLGISPRAFGENVAWFQGYSDAQAAQVLFEGWRESDGHYCNMMSAGYTSFGVGVYKGSSRTWGTQNFYATR